MKMKDFTVEEEMSYHESLDKIYKSTGIKIDDFDNEVEELDFVAEHPKIPVKIHVTEIK